MKFNIQKHKKFIEKTKKPFYLYDKSILEKKYDLLRTNLDEKINIFYSMKANPNINFVKTFRDKNAGIEIASIGELETCLKLNVNPKKIIFAGPGKSLEELEKAVLVGIKTINIESFNELKKVNKICNKHNKSQDVNIRINPNFKIDNSILQMGGGAMKFGIDFDILEKNIQTLLKYENLNIKGIHVFGATQVLDENLIEKYFKNVFRLFKKIESLLDTKLEILDIGSGFGIDYKKQGNELNMSILGEKINTIFKNQSELYKRENFSIILESGRYLAAESGVYITKVIDKKKSRDKNFAIVKGGINHLLRPALIEQSHYIEILNSNKNDLEKISIGGQLCTGLDFFVKDEKLPVINIDDTIAIYDTGAYGYSESMLYFLSHSFPKEYMVYKDKYHLIRKSKDHSDFVNNQIEI